MKKFYILLFVLLNSVTIKAQDLPSHQFILIPQKFEFLKENNQYQLNQLMKFLFEKRGYSAIMEGESNSASGDINRCKALTAGVKDDSGLFVTRLNVVVKDCNGKEVFISEAGSSRQKDFQQAYHEALREAFESISTYKGEIEEAIVTAVPDLGKTPANLPKAEAVVQAFPAELPTEAAPTSPAIVNEKLQFEKDNSLYYLEKTEKGFSLYQKDMQEPFAALIRSAGGNYIYSSINSQGMAFFDEKGNLVVEILNVEKGSLESFIYKIRL